MTEVARSPKRARFYVTRVDPWSVTKVAFLLSLAIGIILVVGAVTPINEFYKAVMGPGAPYDTGQGLREIIEARSLPLPRHYVARLNQEKWFVRYLF